MPSNDLGTKGISFHNCTFNFGGVEGKEWDVQKMIKKIVDELSERTKQIEEEPVSILRKHCSKKAQCIEHIDFGSISENTVVNAMATPQSIKNAEATKKAIKPFNPYKKTGNNYMSK